MTCNSRRLNRWNDLSVPAVVDRSRAPSQQRNRSLSGCQRCPIYHERADATVSGQVRTPISSITVPWAQVAPQPPTLCLRQAEDRNDGEKSRTPYAGSPECRPRQGNRNSAGNAGDNLSLRPAAMHASSSSAPGAVRTGRRPSNAPRSAIPESA